jgi:hypothetical protein
MTVNTVELISPANESVQQTLDNIKTFIIRRVINDVSELSNYWDSLPIESKNYLINAWNTLDAKYAGIGTCQSRFSCYGSNSPKYLYNYTMQSPKSDYEPSVLENSCHQCIASTFTTMHNDELFIRLWDGLNKDIMPSVLFVHPERTQCSCSYPIPLAEDIMPSNHRHESLWIAVQAIHDEDNEEEQEIVHSMCSFECSSCNKIMDRNNINRNRADDCDYCESCWENMDTYYCERCEEYSTDETIWSDVRNRDLCSSCYDDTIECDYCEDNYYEEDGHECDEYTPMIRNYSYKPTPIFWPHHDSKFYYLGIELEVESKNAKRSDAAAYVSEFLSEHAYLKEDGSLENGFEIVTHPHTLDAYHQLDWSFLDKLKSMGVRSWNTSTCGLHVHVGRVAFDMASYPESEKHLIRFTKFIYDNEQQVTRIAGRTSNYAGFNDKGKVIPKIKHNRQSNDRYSAVNIYPEYTVEIRVFKGSLRKERVLSGIEFVHAAVEFTRDMKIVPKQIPFSWARFITYVTNNQETYPNLFIILNETFARDYNGNEES